MFYYELNAMYNQIHKWCLWMLIHQNKFKEPNRSTSSLSKTSIKFCKQYLDRRKILSDDLSCECGRNRRQSETDSTGVAQ